MTNSKIDLLTMRQYLFLHWLFQRSKKDSYCNNSHTDIDCHNCLDKNDDCQTGLIPASYFYKKIGRQYYDCKRVLDSLEKDGYIDRKEIDGNSFTVFYQITENGINFYKEYCNYYALN